VSRRIFVTGGTGLVGNGIVRHFLDEGWDVVMGTSTPGLRPVRAGLRIVPFHLSDPATAVVRGALAGCAGVIHAAAMMPAAGRAGDVAFASRIVAANTLGTLGLLQAASLAGVPHAVTIGRTAAHLDPARAEVREDAPAIPTGPYGLSKHLSEAVGEYMDRESSTRVAVLRISAPYGPGYRVRAVIPTYVERALAGETLEVWGSGSRTQTFTYTADIARACVLAIERRVSGVYNVAGPDAVSTLTLARAVLLAAGQTGSRIEHIDREDPGETVRVRVSIDKARTELGYAPAYDLDAGLRELVAALRSGREPLWSTSHDPVGADTATGFSAPIQPA
jgi:nucleoside-diphosphate-sugar epimerase